MGRRLAQPIIWSVDDSAGLPFGEDLPVRVGPEELVDDRYLLDAFLENTPDHVYFKDHESRFIRISQALAVWLGLEDAAEAIGRSDFEFFGEEHARKAFADEQHLMQTGEALVGVEERETWEDGRETWVSTTKVPLRDRRGRVVGIFGLSRDITEKKLNEQRLATQADRLAKQARALGELTLVDDLTQLHNRRGFASLGEQALYRARHDGTPLGLVFLDIDHFKQINDTFGHSAGDEALQAVANAIRNATRESDIAARVGGDEFCILLTGKDAAAVEPLVERIKAALHATHNEGSLAFELSISIGALHVDPRTPGSLEEMLAKADKSMYNEKLSRTHLNGQTVQAG
jgi:diguanylate cyclase (GGDEF)-like protein/PAS domain S-box-containing protein